MKPEILRRLEGGDRRSLGRTEEVVAEVLERPELFGDLFRGMLWDDPVVRMRAADAVEKITGRCPELLHPWKTSLLDEGASSEQMEVRWHVAQMLPRLALDAKDIEKAAAILFGYLDDRSSIVKTFAMQALADLSRKSPPLLPWVAPLLHELTETATPAMQSRGRKLLEKIWEKPSSKTEKRRKPH